MLKVLFVSISTIILAPQLIATEEKNLTNHHEEEYNVKNCKSVVEESLEKFEAWYAGPDVQGRNTNAHKVTELREELVKGISMKSKPRVLEAIDKITSFLSSYLRQTKNKISSDDNRRVMESAQSAINAESCVFLGFVLK